MAKIIKDNEQRVRVQLVSLLFFVESSPICQGIL